MHPSLAVHQTPNQTCLEDKPATCGHQCPSVLVCEKLAPVRGGLLPKRGFLDLCTHLLPFSHGLDPSLVHMGISGGVSALCGWEGEGMFVRQEKGGLDLD